MDPECELDALNYSVKSGLGDRLGYLMVLAALGDALGCRIAAGWWSKLHVVTAEGRLYEGHEKSTSLYSWPHVAQIISFPRALQIEATDEQGWQTGDTQYCMGDFLSAPGTSRPASLPLAWGGHGTDLVPEVAFQWWVSKGLLAPGTMDKYLAAYAEVGKQLAPGPAMPVFGLERGYFVLHMRRNFAWTNTEYETGFKVYWAEVLLQAAMKTIFELRESTEALKILVLSDAEDVAAAWRQSLVDMGAHVLDLPSDVGGTPSDPARVALDMFLTMNSLGVIASVPMRGGWSSFSAIPAMIRRLPLLTVYNEDLFMDESRYDSYARLIGGRLRTIFHFGSTKYDRKMEVQGFLQAAAEVSAR